MQPVAVVGGGLAGVCAALELADNGASVDLYEANDDLIAGVSYWCEGKIHLGFVYAMDPTLRTARTMIAGASSFKTILSRYISREALDAATSAPFVYAVPRDSMLPIAAIVRHFECVDELLQVANGWQTTDDCLGAANWRRMAPCEINQTFDDHLIASAFQTAEVAIDPLALAIPLRHAVHAHDGIAVLTGTCVSGFRPADHGQGTVLSIDREGRPAERRYRHIINATWSERLALDETIGIPVPGPVIHRYKVGLHGSALPEDVPSVTFLVGQYGDVVRFPGRSYQSWYPAGLLATSTSVRPPDVRTVLEESDLTAIARETQRSLSRFMPSARDALARSTSDAIVKGGWITAWGRTGIEDHASQLHQRHQVGVAVHGPYITLDTGKFTLAPKLGVRAARLALGP